MPRSRGLTSTLHVLALHAVAVAAPLYDVLRRNREFFVAYHVTLLDLVAFVTIVSLVLPVAFCLVPAVAGLAGRRWSQAAVIVLVGLFAAALASQVAARAAWPLTLHLLSCAAAGIAAAALYARLAIARTFVTFLSPAILVVPAILLLHPSMKVFVRPENPAEGRATPVRSDTPIVMVVFDQLPLTSLVTPDGRIDATHYPGFAALASASTWYRRATTVADLTGWALPPIVSGRYPVARRLPVAEDYPDNLFAFLARSHRMEVVEPLTALCPKTVCGARREPWLSKAAGMLADSGIVYAYLTTPAALASSLPPLTENWRGFIAADRWQQRWMNERDADRRAAPEAFLSSIRGDDPQPTLYFLHALLPHEPYMYLPSGQRFTDRSHLIGLRGNGRWVEDEWAVTQNHAAELLQVGYVDRYVGRLVQRLQDEGLYDRALLIVTADHGASFRPGYPFKGVNMLTVRDIAPVPLFVKLPFQREGAVSDRNVQSIDIVPLIADVLGAPLTWEPEGVSPLDERAIPPPMKTIFHSGMRQRITISPDDLFAGGEAITRRVELLGGEDVPFRTPRIAPNRELVGRHVEPGETSEETELRVVLEGSRRYLEIDTRGELMPAWLHGQVMDEDRGPASAALAIAVNGRIEATTQTYDQVPGFEGVWTALLDPRVFRQGRNDVDVFIVRESGLTRAFSTALPALASINLISDDARTAWGAELSGFHSLEGEGRRRFRWTSGQAEIELDLPGEERPRSLRLGLAPVSRKSHLRVSYNGCGLFDADVPGGGWYKTLSLDNCPEGARTSRQARIRFESPTFTLRRGDTRTLGVPFETVRLSAEPWPLAAPAADPRARVRIVQPERAENGLAAGSQVLVDVVNLGSAALASAAEVETDRPARLVPSWGAPGEAPSAAGPAVDLPRVLYPGERVHLWIRLEPPDSVSKTTREAEVVLRLMQGEHEVPLASPGSPRVWVKLR